MFHCGRCYNCNSLNYRHFIIIIDTPPQSDIEKSGDVTEKPATITELTLCAMGYEAHHSLVSPPSDGAEGSKWVFDTSSPLGSRPSPRTSGTEGSVTAAEVEQRPNSNGDYDDIYEQPPSNEKDLYSQLAKRHYDNILRNAVK